MNDQARRTRPSWPSLAGLLVLVLCISAASQWWAGRHDERMGGQMAALAGPGDIHMLSSQSCVICATTRMWLERHEVQFSECLIETDADCAARFEAARAPGTPVLVVRGHPQLGFDPQRVVDTLRRSAPAS